MKAILYGFLTALLVTAALAGSNNLPLQVPGIIQLAHINKFQIALSGDIVPRNSLGNVGDTAASVGNSLYRWGTFYGQRLTLQNGATELPVQWYVPVGNTTAIYLGAPQRLPADPLAGSIPNPPNTAYQGRFTSNLTIDSQGFLGIGALSGSAAEYGGSGESGTYANATSTYTLVTNMSATVNVARGRALQVFLQGGGAGADSYILQGGTGSGYVQIGLRDTANPACSENVLWSYQIGTSLKVPSSITTYLASSIMASFTNRTNMVVEVCAKSDSTVSVFHTTLVVREI